VGNSLTLWIVAGELIIWSFFVRCWVSFRCLDYSIITSVMFMPEGQWTEFTMLGLIVERCNIGKNIVAAIALSIWLSCIW
jgi:hypothetical protein